MTASALGDKIARRIRAEGPLSVAAFMAMALHDPDSGYYAGRDPIGAAGDFITAPEISQVFGELIGLWGAEIWRRLGEPDPVMLVELGPGRGLLMSDMLRAAAVLPAFRRALRVCLVETSGPLRAAQQCRLASAKPLWVERFDAVPDGPILLVANEFLDALPVRQLVRGHRDWAERVVALDPAGRLVFAAGPENPAMTRLVPPGTRGLAPGSIVEICPMALMLATTIAERLRRSVGAALFIDYGDLPKPPGSSLRAVCRHRAVGVLDEPGAADLSAHVDFAAFAAAAGAAGATVNGPVAQGRFLAALGAEARLAKLCARASPGQRAALESGVARLVDPGRMGELFKAIALASPGLPSLPGFAAAPAAADDRGAER